MQDITGIVLAVIVGLAISGIYVVGLWLTVRELPRSSNPAAIAFLSFFLRAAVVVGAVVFIATGSWQRALACMGAFVVGRLIMVRLAPAFPTETVSERSKAGR